MKGYKKLGMAALLATAVALSGCTADPTTPAGPDDAPSGDPVAGGTLNWAIDAPPSAGGLDPMIATTIPAALIMNQAYDTLLTKDDDGQIQPALATDWDQPDELTYVFTLREGVKFSDGSDFTADDVVYTFETYQTAQTSKSSYVSDLVSIEANGDYEVTFTTSQPNSTFMNAVSGPLTMLVVGREGYGNASEDERQTQSFGTGPFVIAEWRDGVGVRLERNEHYWKEGLPYIDEINFELIPDETTRLAALQQGSVQAAYFNDGTVAAQAVQAGFTLGDLANTGLLAIYINPGDGPLADLNVRRAFSLALDRDALVDVAMFGNGAVSTSVAVGDAGAPQPDASTPYYTRDVEEAKRLLEEAGQPNPEIEISYLSDAATSHHPVYELMQQQLAEAGITLNLKATPLAELSPTWTAGESFRDLASIPASTKVDPVFHYTAFLDEGAVLNWWGDDPDAERAYEIFEAMKVETDLEEKARLVQELSDEVADKMLILAPMALPVKFEVWDSTKLHGFKSDPYNARYHLVESWLEQ